jgi:hypothetical protein
MKRNTLITALIICCVFLTLGLTLFYSNRKPLKPEPTNRGRNMTQWLQILKTDTNSMESPLKIIQITEDGESTLKLELPLAYDLLLTNDFINGEGHLNVLLNRHYGVYLWPVRSTNGNCLFGVSKSDLHSGTNQIRVEFNITDSSVLRTLRSTGPVFNYVSTNLFLISPNPVSIYTKRLLLRVKVLADQATYRIEIRDTNNQLIQTFSGKPDRDRVIDERWDAVTNSGKDYWGQSVKVIYEVTAPGFPPQTIEHTYQLKFP